MYIRIILVKLCIEIDRVLTVSEKLVPEDDQKSVIAGGNVRGWLPDVAIILWKRMLGALGNVNDIADASLHAQVFHYLIELSNTLIKVRLNTYFVFSFIAIYRL